MNITIENNADCCGCAACAAVCPQDCIAMIPDAEGFFSPIINTEYCIDCGLCIKVCPWRIKPDMPERISPPDVFAAWHLDDEIRGKSSSGGMFTALATAVLARDGAVVGAAFDKTMVCRHVIVEEAADLGPLRGAKYVQSEIAPVLLRDIRNMLEHGRRILFTGTPCQIAGLRNFLGQKNENLFCCDLVCHGVPSPAFFKKHITEMQKNGSPVAYFSFRNKDTGWKLYSIMKRWENGRKQRVGVLEDPYMAAFLRNYSLSESCHVCKFTTTERQGDLTIADFWRVSTTYPEYDPDDMGTSLVLINSEKGRKLLDNCKMHLFIGKADLESAIAGNSNLVRPSNRPPIRDTFYWDMQRMGVRQLRRQYRLHPVFLWRKMLGRLKRRIKILIET